MARPRTCPDSALLAAARAVLVECGPSASLRTIAARTHLTPAALLARFGCREALVRAALTPPSLAPALAPMLLDPEPGRLGAQLQAILAALGAWYAEAIPRALIAHALDPGRSSWEGHAPVEGEPRLHHTLAIWLARAQAVGGLSPVDSHAQAAVVLAALQGQAVARALGDPAGAGVEVEAALLALVLAPGARPQGPAGTRR
jgi:AcrR family transcriptional regulator